MPIWTQEEENFLIENYSSMSSELLCDNLKRNWQAVKSYAHRKFAYMFVTDMMVMIAIKKKIIDLGIYDKVMHRKWDKIDINFEYHHVIGTRDKANKIKDLLNAGKRPAEIAKIMGLSRFTVYNIIKKKNISEFKPVKNDSLWTDEEIQILKDIYSTTDDIDTWNSLPNRTRSSITGMAFRLGLKREKYNDRRKIQ